MLNEAQKARLLKQIDVGPWKTSWHLPRVLNRIDWDDTRALVMIRDVLVEQITDARAMLKESETCLEICVGAMILQEQENEN